MCEAIPGWFAPPHGYTAIRETFGKLTADHGKIVHPIAWEAFNMRTVRDLPGYAHALFVNRKIEPMLRAAMAECVTLGGYAFKSVGCFNVRPKASRADQLSLHSWGVAIDVNPAENPARRITTLDEWHRRPKHAIPDAWVQAFKLIGWTWGGDFVHVTETTARGFWDPMHFQYASGY
jgi:hypothetical protein